MITVLVTVTPERAEKYGEDAWLVNSVVEGETDPYWTIETPVTNLAAVSVQVARSMAIQLHLARTQRDHRISRIRRMGTDAEAGLQHDTDDFDLRGYRAELRLIAKG
jgi:hypothetical protein